MKYALYYTLLMGLLPEMILSVASADEALEQTKIRVLLTTGGHGFEEQPFFAMFESISAIDFTKAELPKDAGLFQPGLEKDYDVIVMYDMVERFTPSQQASFVNLLRTGVGVVSLHHNLCAHRQWEEFRRIIGGKFCFEATVIDGNTYGPGGAATDQMLRVSVADRGHPITRGLEDFEIHDEIYWGCYTDPGSRVLLRTDHPKSHPALAWATKYGNSRVFYMQLGHDRQAWCHPSYRELLARSIRWASGRQVSPGSDSPPSEHGAE